jgi:hypothetical protein
VVVSTGLIFGIISFHHILSAYEINDDEMVTPLKRLENVKYVYGLLDKRKEVRGRTGWKQD